MRAGIVIGLIAYALFSLGDATVKSLSGKLSVFQIGFLIGISGLAATLFVREQGLSWREALRPKRPPLVLLRVASGTTSGLLGIYAFTHLPLAEAYSIIFLAPSFVTLFALLFLKEPASPRRWLAIAIGFVGVLLIVRPAFNQLSMAHLAALGTAISAATTMMVLRAAAPFESRATLVIYPLLASITISGVLMLPQFRWPTAFEVGTATVAGLFAGVAAVHSARLGRRARCRVLP